jgi:hypothetical protein
MRIAFACLPGGRAPAAWNEGLASDNEASASLGGEIKSDRTHTVAVRGSLSITCGNPSIAPSAVRRSRCPHAPSGYARKGMTTKIRGAKGLSLTAPGPEGRRARAVV